MPFFDLPRLSPDAHVRRLTDNTATLGTWVSSCSCGWTGKPSPRKSSAASAWGMHSAAVRRRLAQAQRETEAARAAGAQTFMDTSGRFFVGRPDGTTVDVHPSLVITPLDPPSTYVFHSSTWHLLTPEAETPETPVDDPTLRSLLTRAALLSRKA